MMSLLPTKNVENFFSIQEIDELNKHLLAIVQQDNQFKHNIIAPSDYPDLGKNGRYTGKLVADITHWEYDSQPEIANIITPKLENLLQKKLVVSSSHMLESRIPYLLHTDYKYLGPNPEYTIMIPLDTYDSLSVVFDQWGVGEEADFEIFKQNYQGEKKLNMDPKFCAERLSHVHPKDLMYLTLHDTFAWKKGSVFAFDRRRFHCGDNFVKKGLAMKKAIIIWTLKP